MNDNPKEKPALRRRRLLWLVGGLVVTGGGWAAAGLLTDDGRRSTDDAYVGGQLVPVMAEIAGTVRMIAADNTDRIEAGTALVDIDPTDSRIEVGAAEADLALAVRTTRGLYAAQARLAAEVEARKADLAKARADLAERRAIAATGAVTGEEIRHAADDVRRAEATLSAAEQARLQARAQVQGVPLADHPAITAASHRLRAALLALARTRVLAPVSGMVAQRSVQLGRHVAPGDRLMAVVPLDRVWVDANFKEIELAGVCPGQSATVTADIYGAHTIYHGRVEDVEAGTGAAFALLPAQNATGNWIKVVQRIPVRIALDPAELERAPLRIGLSAKVEISAGTCDRASRPPTPRRPDDASRLYETRVNGAEERIARIIAANSEGLR